MNPMNGKPRGRPASSDVISLYKFLYESARPLSLAEIASRFPSSGYRSYAHREYRAHLELKQGAPVDPDSWTQADRDDAWLWWLTRLLRRCCVAKWVKVTTADGRSARGQRIDRLVYTANRDKPPIVRVKQFVEVKGYWTPEIGRIGVRHAAGMQYLKDVPLLLERPKLPEDVKAVLRQGIVAIRNRTDESGMSGSPVSL